MIKRDRVMRAIVAILSPFCAVLFGYLLGASFAAFFKLPMVIGYTVGLGLGAFIAMWFIPMSYIVNDALGAFVTIDQLITITGGENALVSYGPGFHFCFWWEKRSSDNNVNLSEVAENFAAEVQGTAGTIFIKYSARLRPDIKRLPEFLSGVASVAADLRSIISAEIVEYLSKKSVAETLVALSTLNKMLAEEFKHDEEQGEVASAFEKRFGVIIGDITVAEILPSKEVQKTMDGITESTTLDQIVAKTLGYPSIKEVQDAVRSGILKSEQVAHATENALALTNNLHGMDLKRHTFTLKLQGDSDLVESIKSLGPLASTIAGVLNKDQPKKGTS